MSNNARLSRRRSTDYLVRRLEDLSRIRVQRAPEMNDVGVKLIDRAISATYLDCVDMGRGDEASKIFHALMVELAAGGGM